MHSHFTRTWRTKIAAAGAFAAVLSAFALIASVQAADPNTPVDAIKTATPIKHVIIIVGENRSFDHLFATYVPRHEEEGILNLLSENIITAAGAPGRHFARAHQYQITSAPNGGKFFSSADLKNKALYSTLPPPGGCWRGLSVYRDPEPPGRGPGVATRGSISLRHGWHRAELYARSRHPHHQCQCLAAWAIPDDGGEHALRCLHRRRTPGVVQMGPVRKAFAKNIIELAQSNRELWATTAIFVTVDEGGGYYDSGFIQPVDFFGTGPRIPMIAVSPFSTGGHIRHVYNEHSSFVKFIERNWQLSGTLSERSRDNLPNPVQDDDNTYVPRNMPAIGDLFDLFRFGHEGGDG